MFFVGFRSSSSLKSGLYLLSNFAPTEFTLTWPAYDKEGDDFPVFLKGRTCTYATAEHAYQATAAMDLETAKQFEKGGCVSMDAFRRWPVASGVYQVRLLYMVSADNNNNLVRMCLLGNAGHACTKAEALGPKRARHRSEDGGESQASACKGGVRASSQSAWRQAQSLLEVPVGGQVPAK